MIPPGTLPGIEAEIRIVCALLDEAARLDPATARVNLCRRFAGSRDFERRLLDGRVTLRRRVEVEGTIADWIGHNL